MKRKTLHTLLSFVALLLACLMVLPTLASCKKKEENPVETIASGEGDGPVLPEACDKPQGQLFL